MNPLKPIVAMLAVVGILLPGSLWAYPLDGGAETGIARLDAYWLARQVIIDQKILPKGIFWKSSDIQLRLIGDPTYTLPAPDAALSAKLKEMLGADGRAYGLALLDYTDPAKPVYAAVNPDKPQNPASVGKIAIMLGWFQALADVYPDGIDARMAILKNTIVTADGFIQRDRHSVPVWKPGDPKVVRRPIEEGFQENLWTYMDWMMSASSSAAAGMMTKELMLLNEFGSAYPVSPEKSKTFFEKTPKPELVRLLKKSIQAPLGTSGLDTAKLRQGKFFTREGKKRVPATATSIATARELLRFVLLMEEGKLVDPWSSLEMKKILYLTDARIRYAASPALDDAAVYYKSGSLYSCKAEAGFDCGKYQGNRVNYLNSMAIIETDSAHGSLRYAVVVLSNVLRKDSSEKHQEIAAKLHALIGARH
jgi:hypothetical protein